MDARAPNRKARDRAAEIIVWSVLGVAVAFFGTVGYVIVHFVIKFW